MSDKPKLPRAAALKVATEIYEKLLPFVERCKIAGSLRRRKPFVSDIEVLFIPKIVINQSSLFGDQPETVDLAHEELWKWVMEHYLERRRSVDGGLAAWGPLNKLAIHVASGVPVDFFTANESNWWNLLVCRTGSKASNLRITMAANKRGWTWQPYENGFRKIGSKERHVTTSEADVFNFVGLTHVAPEFRS